MRVYSVYNKDNPEDSFSVVANGLSKAKKKAVEELTMDWEDAPTDSDDVVLANLGYEIVFEY